MEFTYNASALGVGGIVEQRDRKTIIPSLASVALAPTGGEGSAIETNYYSESLAFSRAETRVKGFQQDKDVFTTYADVFVSDLLVFGKLSVGLMQATVISTRNVHEPYSHFQLQALYRDISVDGKDVIPELDIEISNYPTWERFEKLVEAKALKRGKPDEFVERFGARSAEELLNVVRDKQAVQGSVLRKLEHDRTLQSKQHALHVPGVGIAYFGELMLKPERRRVNLLRIKLDGSATPAAPMQMRAGAKAVRRAARVAAGNEGPVSLGGSMTVASVEGNGSPIYP